MQKAWINQYVKLTRSKRPWGQVAGPAGAVVLNLKLLNWKVKSAFEWQTDEGDLLDIRLEAPSSMKKLIRKAIERHIWRKWAREGSAENDTRTRDEEGYWMDEARTWTNGGGKDWTKLQSACLSSMMCGSQWPQAMLYEAGIVDDPLCQACLRAPGTTNHRNWDCIVLREAREQGIARSIVEEAWEAIKRDPGDPLYTRGLMPQSALPKLPPIRGKMLIWHLGREGGTITGMVFTDGSMKWLWWWPETARAGWGVVQMKGKFLMAAYYGTLPGLIQTTPRAELFAICEALRLAILPICIHTDHLPIVDGIARGKEWCLAVGRSNVDLWRLLWFLIEDLGGLGDDLRIVWVAAHRQDGSLNSIGNGWADTMANKGQALHTIPKETLKKGKMLRKKHRQIMKWCGRAATLMGMHGIPPDRQPKEEWPKREPEEKRRLAKERSGKHLAGGRWPEKGTYKRAHKWRISNGRLRCADCGKEQGTAEERPNDECQGSIATRLPWLDDARKKRATRDAMERANKAHRTDDGTFAEFESAPSGFIWNTTFDDGSNTGKSGDASQTGKRKTPEGRGVDPTTTRRNRTVDFSVLMEQNKQFGSVVVSESQVDVFAQGSLELTQLEDTGGKKLFEQQAIGPRQLKLQSVRLKQLMQLTLNSSLTRMWQFRKTTWTYTHADYST